MNNSQEVHTADPTSSADQLTNVVGIEKHYRYRELKQITGLSDRSVRRLFAHEHGVVVITQGRSRSKRKYETCLVPETVVKRVLRRLTRVA